jgi:hypothetical protein
MKDQATITRRDSLATTLAAVSALGSGVPIAVATSPANAQSAAKSIDTRIGKHNRNVTGVLSAVSVVDYGAKGDGVTDDSAAIQAAINAATPNALFGATTGDTTVFFPVGKYLINSPINTYSGLTLRGEGETSVIVQGGSFSGAALLLIPGVAGHYNAGQIDNLFFISSGSVWGIKATSGLVTNSQFTRLGFSCGFCMSFATYTQTCRFDTIQSLGTVDQILHLIGNMNNVFNIDKEGGSGSTTDPYILVETSEAAYFKHILLEQTGSANKVPIKISSCGEVRFEDVWLELSAYNGYSFDIENSNAIEINSPRSVVGLGAVLKLVNSQSVLMRMLRFYDALHDMQDYISIDSASDLHIDTLYTRQGQGTLYLNTPQITVGRVINQQAITDAVTANYPAIVRSTWLAGQNYAVNGSFEAGNYGWTWRGAPDVTEEYITSTVGSGLMGHWKWSSALGINKITQNITVPANMPVTITAKVNCVTGGGSAQINIYTNGAGLVDKGYVIAAPGRGWTIISQTYIPSSAGTLTVGLEVPYVTEAYADEFSVSVGNVGIPDLGRHGTLAVGAGPNTIAFDSAAPTTGTWKKGDVVFNTNVAAGGTPGWSCTTAGSPGTWKAWANVAA